MNREWLRLVAFYLLVLGVAAPWLRVLSIVLECLR